MSQETNSRSSSNLANPLKTPLARTADWELAVGPPPEQWDDWSELDASAWPERKLNHYRCIPTICFNCESGCGLLAFVDKAVADGFLPAAPREKACAWCDFRTVCGPYEELRVRGKDRRGLAALAMMRGAP